MFPLCGKCVVSVHCVEYVSVMKKEDACKGAGKTNIFIVTFTTALACLKVYKELEKAG